MDGEECKMNLEYGFYWKIVCGQCGEQVEVQINYGHEYNTITVTPCKTCLNEAEGKGFLEGQEY